MLNKYDHCQHNLLLIKMEDISHFCGTIGTSVFDLWLRLPRV